jgi:hypothetical protein
VDSVRSGQSPVASFCEYGNEPWGSLKGGTIFDQLSNCLLLNDSVSCNYIFAIFSINPFFSYVMKAIKAMLDE